MRHRVFGHPVVRDLERRRAARRPRRVLLATDVDLRLVPGEVVAVCDVIEERRPDDGVLRRPGADTATGVRGRPGDAARRSGRVAHLDGRAVETDVLRVHRGVEGAPVVPALGNRRAWLDPTGTKPCGGGRQVPVRAPVVDRARHGHADRVHRGLVRVDPGLVPLQPEVVFDARVVRLRRRLDQRRRHVAVEVEHLRRQPLLHDRDRGLRLGLRLGQEVAVQVEVVPVRPLIQRCGRPGCGSR